MFKQSKFLIFLGFVISVTSYGQQRMLVFNKEGRIIKNYGYDSYPKGKLDITFLIDDIDKENSDESYYLLWEWRNEYNHSTVIIENKKFFVAKFTTDGRLELNQSSENKININGNEKDHTFKINEKNQRLMNFILLKTNIEGDSILSAEGKVNLKDLFEAKNISVNLNNYLSSKDVVQLLEQNKIIKENSEHKDRTAAEIKVRAKKIDSLNKKIEVIRLALDKLGMIDEASGTPKRIIDLQETLVVQELELIEIQHSKSEDDKKVEKNEKKIEDSKKRIDNIYVNTHKAYINSQRSEEAYYNILHEGVLLSKDKNVKEIVYDIHNGKLFDSEKEQLRVARLSPNLPQLTTDSELYCHIINLKPEDIQKNPFTISMEAQLSEPVDVESPSNLRELQDLSLGNNLPNPSLFNKEVQLDGSSSIDDEIKGIENNLDKLCQPSSLKMEDFEGIYSELKGINDTYLRPNAKKEFKEKFEDLEKKINEIDDDDTLILSDTVRDTLIAEFKPLMLNLRGVLQFEKKILQLPEKKSKLVLQNFTPASYTEYILKYPRPFEAKRKPTIKLLSNQYSVENYTDKVVKGKHEGPTYDIKYGQDILVKDELPAVHRLYRFSINAGVLLTNSVSYNYEAVPLANSSVSDLKEIKETSMDFRPSITFSTYLKRQDLAVNEPFKRWLHTTHIDVSIDYDDGDILDNIYLGVGIEPLRNIQLAFGARFGQVDRLDPNNYDPFLPISDQKFSSELDVGYYVSLSLGFDLIPKFYNLIVKK